ncbi:MAG: type III-B CRISPR module RAMP protein Cmr6 [Eubacterium sp.]
MTANLNYVFNKAYYSQIVGTVENSVAIANQQLIEFQFNNQSKELQNENIQTCQFKTTYPGLLIGLGTTHEIKDIDEAIKVGFSFDYVTGLPYIPGSSVKGMLRSAFHVKKRECISEIFKAINETKFGTITEDMILEIEHQIFGQGHNEVRNRQQKNTDVFFDAVVVHGATDRRLIKRGNLLDYEYITSHQADDPAYNGLVALNPVRLLKVRPGVTFEFRFLLKNIRLRNDLEITQDEKLELFKAIIELIGVGAKTNVGYGQMVLVSEKNKNL